MNFSIPLLVTGVLYTLAYFFYARYIAGILGIDRHRATPSVTLQDNVDYVPTRLGVVFSHHFASIAGGGPILGPTLALIYGYQITLVWLMVGCIFFGAVHDFVALFISVREGGKSMAEVARQSFGNRGFFLFIAFTVVMLIMVVVAFLGATVAALTSKYPLAQMGLPPDQTLLKTVLENGVLKGKIGGIASTSVFVITGSAPLIGYLLYRRGIRVWLAALLAMAVCALSILVGLRYPVALSPDVWRIALCLYVFAAAGLPVWLVLQPRDFINSFILYFGIALIALALLFGGISHLAAGATAHPEYFRIQAPALNLAEGSRLLGLVWPILFITVACGAISGFHALVAGGTSSKQLCREDHTGVIGFGGMLLEGVLAVGVLSVVATGLSFNAYRDIVFPSVQGVSGNPILAFALSLGAVLKHSLGIPSVFGTVFGILLVEGFVVTTLDTAVRLCRYLLEELWAIAFKTPPALFRSYAFNAGVIVALTYLLSLNNSIEKVWPVFGAANQLLAALVLMVASVWLKNRNKPTWFVTVPAAFMLVTTVASLGWLLVYKHIKTGNIPLVIADALLLALSVGFVLLLAQHMFRKPAVSLIETQTRHEGGAKWMSSNARRK